MALVGVVVDCLLAGLVDSSGNPLASGKVYTYDTGTTTPKSLYTDQGLSSAAANPLILSANGTSQVYANGSYKFVVKTAADATVATWDALAFYPLSWATWSPTLTPAASMTYTSTSVTFARFVQIGKVVHFKIAFTGTVGGTPSTYIGFTLPVTSDGAGISASVAVLDNSSLAAGFSSSGSSTRLDVYRYNNVAFTAGTVSLNCYGTYEAA